MRKMKTMICPNCEKRFEDFVLRVNIHCVRRYCPHCDYNFGVSKHRTR